MCEYRSHVSVVPLPWRYSGLPLMQCYHFGLHVGDGRRNRQRRIENVALTAGRDALDVGLEALMTLMRMLAGPSTVLRNAARKPPESRQHAARKPPARRQKAASKQAESRVVT